MTTMTLAEDRITVAGVDVLVKQGQRVRIDRTATPSPIVGVWLALDSQSGNYVMATVLDDERGVQPVTFHSAHLSLLEDIDLSEQEGKVLAALMLAERMRRTQAGEFEAWKGELAERAGDVATEHGFCEVYDRLMEEFGLPVCRNQDFEVSVLIRHVVTVNARNQESAEENLEWSDIWNDLQNCPPYWEVCE